MEDSPNQEIQQEIADIEQQENEALLEELIEDAKIAEEPGAVAKERYIHMGDDDAPVPMRLSKLESAGYVIIYEIATGESSVANRNMLPALLKVIDDTTGKRRFTTRKPRYEPKRGTYKCMLHPTLPNRAAYDEMGLPVCMKSNITNQYQVEQHMKKKHSQAWAALERERVAREKEEERDFQRSLIIGRQSSQGETGLPCPICKEEFDNDQTLIHHMGVHKTKKKT